jgi:hypothetical protein
MALLAFEWTISQPFLLQKNPQHHRRIKHLDLIFYWLRDAIELGKISVDYIPTAGMPADSRLELADVLNSTGEPRKQAQRGEIEV